MEARTARRTGALLVGAGVVLSAWVVRLALTLPHDGRRPRWFTPWSGLDPWTLLWVGLDTLEVLGLLATGVLLVLRRPAARSAALLSVPLFVLDGWFDVLTSVSRADLAVAVARAVLLELPAAALLAWVAWRAPRRRERARRLEPRSGSPTMAGERRDDAAQPGPRSSGDRATVS